MSDNNTVSSSTASAEEDVFALQARITQLQSTVRQLKKDGGDAALIASEVEKLQQARARLVELTAAQKTQEKPFNRKTFDELILRKMYVVPSFEIHNGPAGLFDYGPPACALKANVLALWRRHFVLEENMLEMECTNLTPQSVLQASGHVERFTDFMVKDEITGDCFRADKLLEDVVDTYLAAHPELSIAEQESHRLTQRKAGAMSADELETALTSYNVKSPTNPTHNLTKPFAFNLMFRTTIGPEGITVGFLRPETAQGLFVNFRRLLDYNQQKMPFAAAQIGLGFRNEIAPRNGLLRVREFTMAEIEHFVNPNNKRHPKFPSIRDLVVRLFPASYQLETGRMVEMSVGEAVDTGLINNETLGYFMARTWQFLGMIGIDYNRLRFRQHLKTEMSHYAADCWDAEIQTSYGWIECVGHADRACYDLSQHAKVTGVSLVAAEKLPTPIVVEKLVIEPNKKELGPVFKARQKDVIAAIEALNQQEDETVVAEKQAAIEAGAEIIPIGEFEVPSRLLLFKREKKTMSETKYVPSVIEPSYGIGRILYAVMEHAFSQRVVDANRCVMSFKPVVAPIKLGLFRLINHLPFDSIIERVYGSCMHSLHLSVRVDSSSGTVGRRYARADELGIPFGVTVDFQTLVDDTVTLRERDSMAQVRLSIDTLYTILPQLVAETLSWETVMKRFVVVNTGNEVDDEEETNNNNKEESQSNNNNNNQKEAAVADASSNNSNNNVATTVQFTARGSFSRPRIALADHL
jgi:glycyl-tRNA synthetase